MQVFKKFERTKPSKQFFENTVLFGVVAFVGVMAIVCVEEVVVKCVVIAESKKMLSFVKALLLSKLYYVYILMKI